MNKDLLNEKIKQYEQLFKENNVKFTNEEELKSILKQMYSLAQLLYEQFKLNNKNKDLCYEVQ